MIVCERLTLDLSASSCRYGRARQQQAIVIMECHHGRQARSAAMQQTSRAASRVLTAMNKRSADCCLTWDSSASSCRAGVKQVRVSDVTRGRQLSYRHTHWHAAGTAHTHGARMSLTWGSSASSCGTTRTGSMGSRISNAQEIEYQQAAVCNLLHACRQLHTQAAGRGGRGAGHPHLGLVGE